MPKIIDNIQEKLSPNLKSALNISYRSDFCVGYFNLRGWKEVVDEIEKFDGGENKQARILIGMQKQPSEILHEYFALNHDDPIDNSRANKIRKQFANEFKQQLTVGLPTEQDEISLQKLSKQIKGGKVVVKLFLKHTLHAKLYLAYREDSFNPLIAFLGSSNLTFSGLIKQGELNVDVLEQDAAQKLQNWFDERWNDRWCIDISKELIDAIDTSWATEKLYSPYHIYLQMAYHLSREARAGINEFNIPKVFKETLFEFQQKAVLIAAHHLHKRDGVLIGDVVGLGKTITASALAKIFEDDFFLETLIICPKNLVDMWEEYAHKYQLRAKVLPITMVQQRLPGMRRYRVVIIDESHNLRNRESKRYRAIHEYISLNASKVILLTATPYNKDLTDLSNQLRLFIEEDKDLGISPENEIERVGGRAEFNAEYQVAPNTLAGFEKSTFMDDWRELMRLFLVRRTRSFIKNNYAKTDEISGRQYLEFHDGTKSYFPNRIPKKLEYEFRPNDPNDQYAKLYSTSVVNLINGLELPRYGLANYLIEDAELNAKNDERIIIENLSRAGKRLMGFARTNLFKRLESSGFSFLLSIARHIIRNYVFAYAIENGLPLPIGAPEKNMLDGFIDDLDIEGEDTNIWESLDNDKLKEIAGNVYEVFANNETKFDWIRTALFKDELKNDLIDDAKNLQLVLNKGKGWKPENDRQLKALLNLCTEQFKNDKILIFTQYADTAKYLYNYFKEKNVDKAEIVTGDSDNPTALAHRFSPISNEKPHIAGTENELRILITTDVLSEGQNLQDAHIVLNYDLPWAIIRLIQRAGRVDRIGQKADNILCYSVLPEDGVENIINLRRRLSNRIEENAEVVGSDETFFEGDPVNISDLYNEKAGILDDDETEVDLASYAYQIWKNATDENPAVKKQVINLPNVVFATKHAPEILKREGVITYARTPDDNDFLTVIDGERNIVTQSQLKILKIAKCEPDEKPLTRMENHHELVRKGIENISETEARIGGQLGRKTSARYRVYKRLDRFYTDNVDTLFANDALKRAVEDIYKYPLREVAREILNRQLKAGINDEDLAELVVSLRDENKLSIVEDEELNQLKEPQIICSMGLKNIGNS